MRFGGVLRVTVNFLAPPDSVRDEFVPHAENGLVELLIGPTCASISILVMVMLLSGVKVEISEKSGSLATPE